MPDQLKKAGSYFFHFIIVFILIDNRSFTQSPGIEWQNNFGGSGTEYLYSLIATADGGFLASGYSSSGISGNKAEPNYGVAGTYDDWIIKLDESGNIEWQNTIGGDGDDHVYCAIQTPDGGYLLAGNSTSGISGDKTEACFGGADYWIIKLDATGNITWQKTIGGDADDFLRSVLQTPDGGYVLGGWSASGISGNKTEINSGGSDYWLVRLNSSGEISWQKTFGGTGEDNLYTIMQTSDNNYLLGGRSTSDISGDKTENTQGGYDYWIVETDTAGNLIWQNTIGGNNDDYLYSIAPATDGGYLLGGWSASSVSGDKSETVMGGIDYWVVKIDPSGIIQWQNTIGGNHYDYLYSISPSGDGGYILAGKSNSALSFDKTENGYGGWDYWVIKLNSTGNIIWQKTMGGSGDDHLYALTNGFDGGFEIGGMSSSGISGIKSQASFGSADYWILKLEACPAYYPDNDADGYGDVSASVEFSCVAVSGKVNNNSDCNDSDASIHPSASEVCNLIDDDCNGIIDEGTSPVISISAGGPTTFCQGNSVVLSATHNGASLQWKKNGANIPGATNSSYTANSSGTFTCQSVNLCGTTISSGIVVSVNKLPNAVITAGGPTTFCAGGSVTLGETAVAGCSYQWFKGVILISGATTTDFIATTTGNYKCRVTKNTSGCSKYSNIIHVTVNCREGEITSENNFTIFPNPAKEFINIESGNILQKKFYITDLTGQEIMEFQSDEILITIDISDLAAGIYFITMEDDLHSVAGKFVCE